jgi:Na+/proline symporter
MVAFVSLFYARLVVPLGVGAALSLFFLRTRWAHPAGALAGLAVGAYEFYVSGYRWSHFWNNALPTWANFRRFAFREVVLALGPALLAVLVYTIIHAPRPPGKDRLPAKARAWLNAHKPSAPIGVPLGLRGARVDFARNWGRRVARELRTRKCPDDRSSRRNAPLSLRP